MHLGLGLSDRGLALSRLCLLASGPRRKPATSGGHGRADHILEPRSERQCLGPLAREAVCNHEALAALLLNEVDGPGSDEHVRPGPGPPPHTDGLEDHR
eukprot:797612-Pyramimonas_sp.AAC.1